MDDLTATRLCAEAMGYEDVHVAHGCRGTAFVKCGGRGRVTGGIEFRPLHDDAQMVALVKRFDLEIRRNADRTWWVMGDRSSEDSPDLNRAVVYCVARMQQAAENSR